VVQHVQELQTELASLVAALRGENESLRDLLSSKLDEVVKEMKKKSD